MKNAAYSWQPGHVSMPCRLGHGLYKFDAPRKNIINLSTVILTTCHGLGSPMQAPKYYGPGRACHAIGQVLNVIKTNLQHETCSFSNSSKEGH